MREAHVRFELDHWRGERLEATLREEVQALVDWLDTVAVADVLPAGETAGLIAGMLGDIEVTEELVGVVVEVLLASMAAVTDSEATVTDVVEREDVHDFVRVAVEMPELRTRVIEALTDNPAYHQLVAHVLYHGVKAFVLSENIVARKVPGAQSLIKFGQRSLNTAVPGLEEGVDRRLQRFVQGQIGETLTDSKRFIEHYFTSGQSREFVDAAFTSLSASRLGEVGNVVSEDEAKSLARAMRPIAEQVLRSGLLGRLAEPTIERVLTSYGSRTVATLLDGLGLDREAMTARFIDAWRPLASHGVEAGYLEGRLRARLDAFYAGQLAGVESDRLTAGERTQLAQLLDKLGP